MRNQTSRIFVPSRFGTPLPTRKKPFKTVGWRGSSGTPRCRLASRPTGWWWVATTWGRYWRATRPRAASPFPTPSSFCSAPVWSSVKSPPLRRVPRSRTFCGSKAMCSPLRKSLMPATIFKPVFRRATLAIKCAPLRKWRRKPGKRAVAWRYCASR